VVGSENRCDVVVGRAVSHRGLRPELPRRASTIRPACFYTPTSFAQLSAAVDRSRRAGTAIRAELELVRTDGDMRLVDEPRARPSGTPKAAWPLVRGSIQDITEGKRAELELIRLNRALRAFSRCNQALIRTTNESTWFHDVCRIVIEEAGYRFCWVGARGARRGEARHRRRGGRSRRRLPAGRQHHMVPSEEAHLGPTGTCIKDDGTPGRHGHGTDASFRPVARGGRERGYASIIAIPVVVAGERYGALSIYATEAGVFSNEEVELLSELAADLGYGVTTLRLRAEQQRGAEEIRLLNTDLERRVLARTADLEVAREREARVGFKIQQMLLLTQPPTDVPGGPDRRADDSFAAGGRRLLRLLQTRRPVPRCDRRRRHGQRRPSGAAGGRDEEQLSRSAVPFDRRQPRRPAAGAQGNRDPGACRHGAAADRSRKLVTLSYVRLDLTRRRLELVDCGHYRHACASRGIRRSARSCTATTFRSAFAKAKSSIRSR